MRHYISVFRHQYALYVMQFVAFLAIIQHAKIHFSTFLNIHKYFLKLFIATDIEQLTEFEPVSKSLHQISV